MLINYNRLQSDKLDKFIVINILRGILLRIL